MKIQNNLIKLLFVALLLNGLFLQTAQAGVTVGATRVIYNAEASEADIKVSNTDKVPALIQSWVDKGNMLATPDKEKVPFIVTPPLARIEPQSAQTLRIFFTKSEALPQDKESLFWLDVLEIPPQVKPEDRNKNRLQIAVRSRFKLFYRPKNLPGTAHDAVAKINWSLKKIGEKKQLEAKNLTPFYISLSDVDIVEANGSLVHVFSHMLSPGEIADFELKDKLQTSAALKIKYTAIGDYGDLIKGKASFK